MKSSSKTARTCGDDDFDEFNNSYADIYAKLAADRIIFLKDNLTKEIGSTISALLIYYDNIAPNEEINFYINTNGGDSSALTNIYDVMQMISAPINTICIGKAYSAGAFLLAAGTKRYMYRNARVMIHGVQFAFPPPTEAEMQASENYLKFIDSHNSAILNILATHTKQPLNKVKEDCSRDLYLTSSQAMKYGLVDAII